MKKLFSLLLAVAILFNAGMLQAQTDQKTTQTTKPATTTTHTKKDGTPDKRYKENKTSTSSTTTHTKKDGTPDKRYKENKSTSTTTPTTTNKK